MEELNLLTLEQVEQRFTDLFSNHPDFEILREAYVFARNGHEGQMRDGTDVPYIIHPLRMVVRLKEDFNVEDKKILMGAFFHDLFEDTITTATDISTKFGVDVALLVQDLTRERPPFESPENKHSSKKAFMKKVMEGPEGLRQIIAVDKIDSMIDWLAISSTDELAQKLPRWLAQAEEMNIPLAETLGEDYVKPMKYVVEELTRKGYRAEYENFSA